MSTTLPLAATPTSDGGWEELDLSLATKTDDSSLEGAGTSLGTTSDIVLAAGHGRIDATMDGLFYALQIPDFDRSAHWGVAIRASWTNLPTVGGWELYLGMGNSAVPAADEGIYFGCQIDPTSFTFAGDYGSTPITGEDATSAQRLSGIVTYRSDRQQAALVQATNSTGTSRAGGERTTDPGTAMPNDDQFVLVGFGNNSSKAASSLDGLKVQYMLMPHLAVL